MYTLVFYINGVRYKHQDESLKALTDMVKTLELINASDVTYSLFDKGAVWIGGNKGMEWLY